MTSFARDQEVNLLIQQLFKFSEGGSKHFEMKTVLSKLVFNVMRRILSGKRYFYDFTESDEESKQYSLLKSTFVPTLLLNFEDAFPLSRWFSKKKKQMDRLQKTRDEFVENMINDHRQRKIDKKTAVENSILDDLCSRQEADPDQYTDDVIKGNILALFTAGTDTSAVIMEWALSLLLNNPSKLEKTRSEIDYYVQGRFLVESDLDNLAFLGCVIKETMRLYPAAPLLVPHESSEECMVGGYHIPRGTILVVNVPAIHRDPKAWEEPEKFMPERFEGERQTGFNFIPFGVGRRMCPGARMASSVVALTLGKLIQSFDWERVGELDMSGSNTGVSVPKAKPLIATCKPRQTMVELFL